MSLGKSTSGLDFPTGVIAPLATPLVPNGWVKCDGSSYDGTQDRYAALWDLVGTTYGGTGQSSFSVPNLGGRVPVGVKATTSGSGLDGAVGAWGGATLVTLTSSQTGVQSHSHSSTWDGSTGDPGHSHTVGGSDHKHGIPYTVPGFSNKNSQLTGVNQHNGGFPNVLDTTSNNTGVTMNPETISGVTISTTTAADASVAHTNIQPQLALEFIIKL